MFLRAGVEQPRVLLNAEMFVTPCNKRMSSKKRAAKSQGADRATQRLKPTQIATHERPRAVVKIKNLRDLLREEPCFAMTAGGTSAFHMSAYIKSCQTVLGGVVQAYIRVNGAFAPATQRPGARKTSTPIAHHMTAADVETLKKRRNEWHNYLKQQTTMLLRAPPASGGATSMLTLATGLWVLIAHANLVLKCTGVGAEMLGAFSAAESRYLTRNALALFDAPIGRYSLTQLTMTILNALQRLDGIDSFHLELTTFVTLLEYRCCELLCLSGTSLTGYDAKQWLEPVKGDDGKEQCSVKFVCHSMCWFLSLYHYIDAHCALSGVLSLGLDSPRSAYVGVAATYALSWFPTADMRERVRRFFAEYAAGMSDQRYNIGYRAFAQSFLPLACDANIYRLHAQTEEALPRNIMNHAAITHHSQTGIDYMRTSMCMVPLTQWLADTVNWRAGDASVRSAHLNARLQFVRELAALYVIHQYMCKHGVRFRFRFLLFHRSPAFFVNLMKAKRNGWPFIVQQFARWCVVVPHRVDPDADAREIEKEIMSLSTRVAKRQASAAAADAAAPQRDRMDEDEHVDTPLPPVVADDAGGANDDNDSSYSYSYYSDDEYDAPGYDSADSDDDVEFSRLLQPHVPPAIMRSQAAARAAVEPPPDAPDDELDDFAAELARMTIELEGDERGIEQRMEEYRTYGEHLPPAAATESHVRVYECRTVFDAFTLWAVALLHVNRGYIDRKRYTNFFALLFGWQTPEQQQRK